MTVKKQREIIIIDERNVIKSWLKDTYSLATLFVLMGAGVWLGSSAMQWFGGFIAILWLIVRVSTRQNRLTIEEAHNRLDELEPE